MKTTPTPILRSAEYLTLPQAAALAPGHALACMNIVASQAATAACVWSQRARVFHVPRCRWAWRIRASNLRSGTREDAVQSGRRACRACGREALQRGGVQTP